jgi:hypothetical protein
MNAAGWLVKSTGKSKRSEWFILGVSPAPVDAMIRQTLKG